MKAIILVILCSSVTLWAKDKPKPVLTDAQKVEILTAERKLMQAHIQALPYMQAEQAATVELQAKQKSLEQVVSSDSDKWGLDLNTLDFIETPKAAPVPETPKVKKP